MGGTWDATNLVSGDVAVLCPIGVDHPSSARRSRRLPEKAGIVKQGKVAVAREQTAQALEVIERRCESRSPRSCSRGASGGSTISRPRWGAGHRRPGPARDVRRRAPADPRGARGAQCRGRGRRGGALLERALDPDAVRLALGSMTSPGRLEVVRPPPARHLDGARKPRRPEALAEALPDTFTGDRLHLVMGVFADKDLEGRSLRSRRSPTPGTRRPSTASARSPRAVADAMAAAASPTEAFPTVPEALDAARDAASEDDLILVTGSLYTVAERPPGAPGGPRDGRGIDAAHREARRRPRGLVGEIVRRAEDKGPAGRRDPLADDRPCSPRSTRRAPRRPFFGELVGFITSGPVVVARLEEGAIDVWRTMIGSDGSGDRAARHDPRRLRADHHREPVRQRLARLGRTRVQAVLRLTERASGLA